jgi:catechol-2,3-dioxygenase
MPPTKLAHVVFQTNNLGAMRDWYCRVLGGHVVYENPRLSFVTYDDEHHRVAFVDFGPLRPRATRPRAWRAWRWRPPTWPSHAS